MFQFLFGGRRHGKNTINALAEYAHKHGERSTNDLHWNDIWSYKHDDWELIYFIGINIVLPGMRQWKIEIHMAKKPLYVCDNGIVRMYGENKDFKRVMKHVAKG